MVDFLIISTRSTKNGIEIFPRFRLYPKSKDLMIQGGDFYAIWIEELGLWSKDESDALNLIDQELDRFANENSHKYGDDVRILYMWDSDSGMIDKWHKFCQKQSRDSYHMLDETLIFSNTETKKENYATKRLSYPLEPCDISAYETLISTLYSEEERHKIEWVIGSIVTGASKELQKFMVLYGGPGTGKSTIINIFQQLFEGYYSVFDAKALGSSNSSFALEPFKTNPLVAIQHDGDLSRIEDNTRLNSIVSHELMTVNEKFKSSYSARFKCFLIMGTNKPVKITDSKSGLLRRLIDVHPSGNKIPHSKYKQIIKQIGFELGGIAYHCRDVYLSDPGCYDDYVPTSMMGASNDFYNFMLDSYYIFKKNDGTTLKSAWEMYSTYCEEAKVPYPVTQRVFKEELKTYFRNFDEKFNDGDGFKLRSYYSGFRTDIFEIENIEKEVKKDDESRSSWLVLEDGRPSVFDRECADCPAQYASANETPIERWSEVKTKLSDIDTSKLHYVKVPKTHIVIDFDLKNEKGEKWFEKNLEAASKWPPTYAEVSKGGQGIHLHYIYTGDVTLLSRLYEPDIEVKTFTGGSSLRRKLTKCNDLPIATISSGLPLKEVDKVMDFEGFKNEKALRSMINKNLKKGIEPSTRCSIDFIYNDLENAYNSGLNYDVSDMFNDVLAFAANSSHQSDYCIKLVNKMKFRSKEQSDNALCDTNDSDDDLIFYDIEVFPNLFLVCWKRRGKQHPIVRMFNPKPEEIEDLLGYNSPKKNKLVGFNCRRYDNHLIYACMLGYSVDQLYKLSQRIINSKKGEKNDSFFREAYNLSYTDIYDFASAGNKKSLKKLEIEMGIHHQELGLPWDEPVPEEKWELVADYCDNDVNATEAAFDYLKGDWTARRILADLAGMTVNDTTNTLTQRIIFGSNKNPQSQFNYRNLAEPVGSDRYEEYRVKFGEDYKFRVFDDDGIPQYRDYIPGEKLPDGWSILPFFPGYKYEFGKSTYLGEEIGEGGRVYSEPGMYGNVWDGDVSSQHPHSVIMEVLFGPKYTKAFKEIVDGRVSIKHEAWDIVDEMMDGKLRPYIDMVKRGELTSKDLANALKTAINSVYGLTSASFENACRDPRNKDNIVAKRGALFMTLLKREVQKKGYRVCHIKTDSIKIPDATDYIKEFVINFGREFGYEFETEAEFDKFCIVNDAVYIAKYKKPIIDKKTGKEIWWTATGKQFAVPYVFKTLFSKDQIKFEDMCETFAVSKGELYLDMNERLPDVSEFEKELDKLETKYKKGKLSDTSFEEAGRELSEKIAEGHNYHYVGRVGQFCPIKPGCGGGVLYRMNEDKYYAASGTTGFRWLETEMVEVLNKKDDIDRSYYNKLVDDAVDTISKYGDFEWFTSDDPYVSPLRDDFINVPEYAVDEEIPF